MTDHQTYSQGDRIPVTIEEELKSSYLDYAMSVIIGRALPDVRDGLKPVHRRILYGMWEGGNTAGRPYKKSARIVGDVMGKYHPHGDAAIYDTAVRMAQDFSMRYPLVDGQGNFGSVDGDAPGGHAVHRDPPDPAGRGAARRRHRQGHGRLGRRTTTAPCEEPVVLPAQFPNLLVNGSSGIAVGMATNIPPHNLARGRRRDCIAVDPQPRADRRASCSRSSPGPTSPPPASSTAAHGIVDAYTHRPRDHPDAGPRASSRRPREGQARAIIVTRAALPGQQGAAGRADRRPGPGASGSRGSPTSATSRTATASGWSSSSSGTRCPRSCSTTCTSSPSCRPPSASSCSAVLDNQPQVFTLRELLEHFIDHRKEVVIRRTRYELARAQERAHILEGLVIALDNLDEVIALIRAAADPADRRGRPDGASSASPRPQAQAILDMRLQRLTGLERDKIVDEYREILAPDQPPRGDPRVGRDGARHHRRGARGDHARATVTTGAPRSSPTRARSRSRT